MKNHFFSTLAKAQEGVAWWVWLLIIIVLILIVLLIWWLLRRRAAPDNVATTQPAAPPVRQSVAPVAPPAPKTPDDLTLIEGIGPKISSVMQAAGINSFNQMAAANPDRLRQILHDADLRLADPTTWPEQARLAAAGDTNGLKVLQDKLKGGRQVS